MRERWFGATGRRVPAIAVEGDSAVPVSEALVLDGVGDVERLREAHARGEPVVVRAASGRRWSRPWPGRRSRPCSYLRTGLTCSSSTCRR